MVDTINLANNLAAAAKRHDDACLRYYQAVDKLFGETQHQISDLRAGREYGNKYLFRVRQEQEKDVRAIVVRSNVALRIHPLQAAALTLQSNGLVYHPSSGGLCGVVEIVRSDGDYWEALRRSQGPWLNQLLADMGSLRMQADLQYRTRRIASSIENISRETLEVLWMWPEEPGSWLHQTPNGDTEQVALDELIVRFLDIVFNPEYKEWTFRKAE